MKKDLTISDLDLDLSEADLSSPLPETSPLPIIRTPSWHVQARVLVVERTVCKCGRVYEAPGAKDILARFVNARNMDTQELSNHPAAQNPELPKATRYLVKQVQVCQGCF